MQPVTLKRLAQELSLSIGTVSRALNDSYDISPATKERVRALAKELNYDPNPYAGSLRHHKSRTIGVIVPEVANPFFALVINGVEEVARQNNYHVLIYLTHEDCQREAELVRLLAGGRVDGILLSVASTCAQFEHLRVLAERHIPLVLFDRVREDIPGPQVTTDDFNSSYRATRHLLDHGCRVIAHQTISEQLTIGQRRKQGYLAALCDFGIEPEAGLVVTAQPTKEQDVTLLEALLRQRPDIDGIFASTERLALSSYAACNNLGRRIGTDAKIIGFSNLDAAPFLNPALTTITQPAYDMGREAAAILFQAVTRNRPLSEAQSVELKSELLVRASTVPPTPA
ncbi:MAG: LacI family DNA-binding transcriptional regulator [Hymenobacter sp.]